MSAGDAVQPVEARPAATLILLRDNPRGGFELYLIRRPTHSSFAPDAYVFPGGAVDPGDSDPALLAGDPEFDLAARARRMGLDADDEARRRCGAYHVAAVRELWEEAGILLGGHRTRRTFTDADAEMLAAARRETLAGDALKTVLERHSLSLRLSLLVYAARFVSPPEYPKRFDARFFLAAAPNLQEAAVNPLEAVEGGWHQPRQVLADNDLGTVKLMPPTRLLCERLAQCTTAEEAMAGPRRWFPAD